MDKNQKSDIKRIECGNISIAYKDAGSGEPFVLIMGFCGTMNMWSEKLLKGLAESFRVIVFDNRGMGETSSSEEDFSIELFAEDTNNLIKNLFQEKVNLLGFSMGSNIALQLALDHPDKVKRLILFAGDCGGEKAVMPSRKTLDLLADNSGTPRGRGERLLKLMFSDEWMKEHPRLGEYFPRIQEQSPPESVAKQFKAIMQWKGVFHKLKDIDVPALLVTGTQDLLTPPENSVIIASEIAPSWLIRFVSSGHGFMYQHPEETVQVIKTFINCT